MWHVNVAAPLNGVLLGYGVGAVVVNLFVRPFLTKTNSSQSSNILVPYIITAALCVFIAVGHVCFYCRTLKSRRRTLEVHEAGSRVSVSISPESEDSKGKKRNSSPYSPRICGQGSFQYGLLSSIFFISTIFFIFGNDVTFSKFFFTFLKFDQYNISTQVASWSITTYWLSYSVIIFL